MLIGHISELGINYGSKILIARYLGPSNYGNIALGVTILTMITVIVILGLDIGISRFLPRFDSYNTKRGVLISGFQIGIISSVIAAGIVVVFAGSIANLLQIPSAEGIIRVIGYTIPFFTAFRLSMGGIRGSERTLPRLYVQHFGFPLLRLFLYLGVIALGGGVIAVAWSYTISYAIATFLGLYFLWKLTPMFDWTIQYSKKYRELLLFSTPLVFATIMYRVFSFGDIFLLSYFTGSPNAVGIYDVVVSISRLLLIGVSASSYLVLPVFSRLDSGGMKGQDLKTIYTTLTKWVVILTLPLFLIIYQFPQSIITYTFGIDYLGGTLALEILALGFFSHALIGPNGNVLQSIGRTRILLIDNSIMASINIILNILLIPEFGFLGAAIATTISYILLNIIYSLQLFRSTGIHPISRSMLSIISISLLVFFTISYLINYIGLRPIVSLVSVLLIFTSIYVPIIIRYGVGEHEITLLTNLAEHEYLE